MLIEAFLQSDSYNSEMLQLLPQKGEESVSGWSLCCCFISQEYEVKNILLLCTSLRVFFFRGFGLRVKT